MADYRFATKAVHSGQPIDPATGSVTVPIYETSTFAFENVEQGAARFSGSEAGYIYTRLGNPTIRALEESVASLENGEDARACASGMAAISMAVLTSVKKGDHVVATDILYGGTQKLFSSILPELGIEFTFVDTSRTELLESAVKDNTRAIFIETPSNPALKITDIRAVSGIAERLGDDQHQ